ncbi:MAG: hypothetical protein AB7T06_06190 [Kofleriaceae bacterium]
MLRLTCSLVREANALLLAYVVRNEGPAPIIVADSLIYQHTVRPDLVVVEDDAKPITVAFKRGYVPSMIKWYVPPPMPSAVSLDAGAELKRDARAPLPLAAFHDTDQDPRPLRSGNTHAVLEVGWIDHPEAHLQRRAIAENTFVETASHWGAQRWLRGERLPLP